MSEGRGHLPTEGEHPAGADLDRLDAAAACALFARADREALAAVERARESLARVVELVAERLASGGRLFYVGSGTSGRLGALDASECPPSFQSDPEQVQYVIAGGDAALTSAVEGAEDDAGDGAHQLARRGVGERDVVVGISAGGTTPFVLGALEEARRRRAATVFLACVGEQLAPCEADLQLRLETGPELLAGSTRLKAGTATKLALNAISTLAMARLGKVHGHLMIDLDARANVKLSDRALRILMRLTGLGREAATTLLERARWRVKTATLMHATDLDVDAAEERLGRAGGVLRHALEEGAQ